MRVGGITGRFCHAMAALDARRLLVFGGTAEASLSTSSSGTLNELWLIELPQPRAVQPSAEAGGGAGGDGAGARLVRLDTRISTPGPSPR